MNTDTKWESGHALQVGDRIRMTHINGDVLHGYVEKDWDIYAAGNRGNSGYWTSLGYSIESAAPMLPPNFGIFASKSDVERASGNALHFDPWVHDEDGWKNLYTSPDVAINESLVPKDMEPLGLITMTDEQREALSLADNLLRRAGKVIGARTLRRAFPSIFEEDTHV